MEFKHYYLGGRYILFAYIDARPLNERPNLARGVLIKLPEHIGVGENVAMLDAETIDRLRERALEIIKQRTGD